jgi:hypothetical protein
MRVLSTRLTVLLASAVLALPGLALAAPSAPAPPVKVTLAQMPEAVQKTVKAETAGGKIKGLFKEIDEEGKTVFEVESVVKGRVKDLNIGEDGTVLVCEQQMSLEELPASVRETMLSAAGKRKIRMVESVTKNGSLAYYEAHVGVGKSLEEITVGLDGARMPQ